MIFVRFGFGGFAYVNICTCCCITASPPPRFLGANPELPTRSSVRRCQPCRRYSGPTAWTARHIFCHDPCPKLQRRNHHSKFWRRSAPRLLPCESDTRLSVVNVPFERNTRWYMSPSARFARFYVPNVTTLFDRSFSGMMNLSIALCLNYDYSRIN